MRGAWCVVRGAWCVVRGAWYDVDLVCSDEDDAADAVSMGGVQEDHHLLDWICLMYIVMLSTLSVMSVWMPTTHASGVSVACTPLVLTREDSCSTLLDSLVSSIHTAPPCFSCARAS